MDAVELVGLLAAPDRLRVVAALVLGASGPAEVAAATGMGTREVATALARLRAAGLVDDVGAVRTELFAQARAAARPPEPDGGVVDRFVRGGRLVGLPAQETKRHAVLEHVAQSFEPGVRYPEREVDAVLRAWTDGSATDHAALRRYLVDHGLLSRERGEYWRSGGWTDVLG